MIGIGTFGKKSELYFGLNEEELSIPEVGGGFGMAENPEGRNFGKIRAKFTTA